VTAIAVKLDSDGPVFFKQNRVGLNGRIFSMYKFRSMFKDAEQRKRELQNLNQMTGPVFKIKNDPRVTRVGRVIRKLSIDELPQLLNVLNGDMSLVGIRPPLPEEVHNYEPWQRRRLSMKPGITCLWQINGRNKVDFKEWIKMDLDYIDNWSLKLDLKILLRTIPAVLFCRGVI
jgi:lipopolysaccharide/colanic/teichoic acid biosynthesis glycosyltransferase